jgi:hypothetical protein
MKEPVELTIAWLVVDIAPQGAGSEPPLLRYNPVGFFLDSNQDPEVLFFEITKTTDRAIVYKRHEVQRGKCLEIPLHIGENHEVGVGVEDLVFLGDTIENILNPFIKMV